MDDARVGIATIQDDELVEVTPRAIRIRKRYLDPHERKRQSRNAEAAKGGRALAGWRAG
jgi:predicted membrane GTPase involved in stress response